jgi:hypothetical protein
LYLRVKQYSSFPHFRIRQVELKRTNLLSGCIKEALHHLESHFGAAVFIELPLIIESARAADGIEAMVVCQSQNCQRSWRL